MLKNTCLDAEKLKNNYHCANSYGINCVLKTHVTSKIDLVCVHDSSIYNWIKKISVNFTTICHKQSMSGAS